MIELLVIAGFLVVLVLLMGLTTSWVQADGAPPTVRSYVPGPQPVSNSTSTASTATASTSGMPEQAPPRVISVSPAPGSTVDGVPAELIVTFSEPVLAASVNTQTVLLVRSGGDGSFGEGNEVPVVPTSVTLTSSTTARVDLAGKKLPNDKYRVYLLGRESDPSTSTSSTSSSTGGSTSASTTTSGSMSTTAASTANSTSSNSSNSSTSSTGTASTSATSNASSTSTSSTAGTGASSTASSTATASTSSTSTGQGSTTATTSGVGSSTNTSSSTNSSASTSTTTSTSTSGGGGTSSGDGHY
ncbi:MAG: Ig-like domain-containing protein [Planctomycetes bacterium]|nr:Ig-like domain-containing protein [Planctomycetota bacterium]